MMTARPGQLGRACIRARSDQWLGLKGRLDAASIKWNLAVENHRSRKGRELWSDIAKSGLQDDPSPTQHAVVQPRHTRSRIEGANMGVLAGCWNRKATPLLEVVDLEDGIWKIYVPNGDMMCDQAPLLCRRGTFRLAHVLSLEYEKMQLGVLTTVRVIGQTHGKDVAAPGSRPGLFVCTSMSRCTTGMLSVVGTAVPEGQSRTMAN